MDQQPFQPPQHMPAHKHTRCHQEHPPPPPTSHTSTPAAPQQPKQPRHTKRARVHVAVPVWPDQHKPARITLPMESVE